MQIGKILISGIAGTTAMTLFSYLVSRSKNKNFREPELLGMLINRLPLSPPGQLAHLAGWGLHYAIGISFVACYSGLYEQTKLKPTFTTGAVLGAVNGVVGATGWKLMFEAHPNPPAKDLKPFFGHLIPAHMVFGAFSAITYKITKENRSKG